MADSILDLNYEDFWAPGDITNWRENPTFDFDLAVNLVEYPGTVHELHELSTNTPQKWGFSVMLEDNAALYALLEKFNTYQGRYGRFFFLLPFGMFDLAVPANQYDQAIILKENGYVYLGYERIGIKMVNGDILTRKVTGVAKDEQQQTMEFTINAILDRDLTLDNIEFITLAVLCRLDLDELAVKSHADGVGEATLQFVELPHEYDLSEGT